MHTLTMLGGIRRPRRGKFIPNEQIRFYREKLGLSQAALADLVGGSQSDIQRLETGNARTTAEWAEKLAPFLGVEPRDLFPRAPGSPRPADAGGMDYEIMNRAMAFARRLTTDDDPMSADIVTLVYALLAQERDGYPISDNEPTLAKVEIFMQRLRAGFPAR